MKPILEHFEDLPEPIRSQAIENYIPFKEEWENKTQTLSDALLAGFDWFESPQGYEYWIKVQSKAARGEFNSKQ